MTKELNNLGYNKKLKGLARRLRKNSTPAEVRLWSELLRSGRMMEYTFLRQRPILNYIADIMCKELKLIIEIDGASHEIEKIWQKDQRRQKKLQEFGFTIIRFTDEEIFKDLDNVQRAIEYWIRNHENKINLETSPPSEAGTGRSET